MKKVYIVEYGRLSVETLIKETEKSLIVEMRYAHNGQYAHSKSQHARYLATLDAEVAESHLRQQFAEITAQHQSRMAAVEKSHRAGLKLLGITPDEIKTVS